MSVSNGDRVRVSASFPADKARINNIHVGDCGTVYFVALGKIALVKWDKGHTTSANVFDLERM